MRMDETQKQIESWAMAEEPGCIAPARGGGLVVALRSGIREFGSWRYLMCPAPDDVLLELFEVEGDQLDPALADYFLGASWRERAVAR